MSDEHKLATATEAIAGDSYEGVSVIEHIKKLRGKERPHANVPPPPVDMRIDGVSVRPKK